MNINFLKGKISFSLKSDILKKYFAPYVSRSFEKQSFNPIIIFKEYDNAIIEYGKIFNDDYSSPDLWSRYKGYQKGRYNYNKSEYKGNFIQNICLRIIIFNVKIPILRKRFVYKS
jgi:hypothetical protein